MEFSVGGYLRGSPYVGWPLTAGWGVWVGTSGGGGFIVGAFFRSLGGTVVFPANVLTAAHNDVQIYAETNAGSTLLGTVNPFVDPDPALGADLDTYQQTSGPWQRFDLFCKTSTFSGTYAADGAVEMRMAGAVIFTQTGLTIPRPSGGPLWVGWGVLVHLDTVWVRQGPGYATNPETDPDVFFYSSFEDDFASFTGFWDTLGIGIFSDPTIGTTDPERGTNYAAKTGAYGGVYIDTELPPPGEGTLVGVPGAYAIGGEGGGEFPPPPPPPVTLIYSGAPPVTGLQSSPQRRLRRAPHLADEQRWLTYDRFQLDLQTGVGLNTGHGEDPQIMLRWSNDGGHTWSNEHWVSAGRMGATKTRAIWRQLGRARTRTFEVVVSDPVRYYLAAAYLDVTPGDS